MPAYPHSPSIYGSPILPEGSVPGYARRLSPIALLVAAAKIPPMEG